MKKISRARLEILVVRWAVLLFCIAFWVGVYLLFKK